MRILFLYSKFFWFKFNFIILDQSKFDDRTNSFKKTVNAKCNSVNRYTCTVDDDAFTSLVKAIGNVENSNLYYNSVSCAKEVLSSGYYAVSVLALLFIALLF